MSNTDGANQSSDASRARGSAGWREGAVETLRAVAAGIESMADALDQDDGIMGALSGMVLANNLPALPAHIRHTFIEYLDDEAAAGLRSETLYYESLTSAQAPSTDGATELALASASGLTEGEAPSGKVGA